MYYPSRNLVGQLFSQGLLFLFVFFLILFLPPVEISEETDASNL